MFKTSSIGKSGISKGMVALAAAAAIAVGSLGFGGTHAEARVNGDPATPFANACKLFQDGYDRAVQAFYDADTPEELLAARADANLYMQAWKDFGCELAYGDVRFIKTGGLNPASNTGLTTTAAGTTSGLGGSLNVAPAQGTATRR